MNAARVRAFAMVGNGTSWDSGVRSAIVPSETALFRLHKFINSISPFNPRRASGGGSGREPDEEGEPHDSVWNDPALWMLMMH